MTNTGSVENKKKKAGEDPLGCGGRIRDPTGAFSMLRKFDSKRTTLSATEDSRPSATRTSTSHQQHTQKI
jgi:hypothetical protein